MTVALVVSTPPSQMIPASVEASTSVPNTSNSNQGAAEGCTPIDPRCGPQDQPNSSGASNLNQQAINHINQAQSALENGDTEAAKTHMDAAKQALGCNKTIDPNC